MKTPRKTLERIDAIADEMIRQMAAEPGELDIEGYNAYLSQLLEEEKVPINDYHDFLMEKFAAIVENEPVN